MPPPTTRRCLGLWEERHSDDDVRERDKDGMRLWTENENALRWVAMTRTRTVSGMR
jgi:hypothetical protein